MIFKVVKFLEIQLNYIGIYRCENFDQVADGFDAFIRRTKCDDDRTNLFAQLYIVIGVCLRFAQLMRCVNNQINFKQI